MKRLLSYWFGTPLWLRILVAVVLGAAAGVAIGPAVEQFRWIGDLFIRLIRMLIVPLVFLTLVSGIVAMGDPRRLGSIGGKTIALYLLTTLAAIGVGLAFGTVLRPGSGVSLSGATPQTLSEPISLRERLIGIVPENPFQAFASGDILAIIFFAVMVGVGLLLAGARARALAELFEAGSLVMLRITGIVMEFAPFGVFALIAWVMGTAGFATFFSVFLLALAVYAGCLVHMALVQVPLASLGARIPYRTFLRGVREPQLVAFSTSSSAATLPVSLVAAESRLGIAPPVAASVLPLGATINMDGTALYVAIVALFSAQIFGVALGPAEYVTITVTTLFVSIGTAAVPSASLFLLAAVLEALGISAAQIALVIGFILPFDRLLDMMRTVVNVTGDLAVASVVARSEGELNHSPAELEASS